MKSQSSKNVQTPKTMLLLETKGISLILKFNKSQEKLQVSLGLKGQNLRSLLKIAIVSMKMREIILERNCRLRKDSRLFLNIKQREMDFMQ